MLHFGQLVMRLVKGNRGRTQLQTDVRQSLQAPASEEGSRCCTSANWSCACLKPRGR